MIGRFELRQKQFPLLNQACQLAGWTALAPYFEGTLLRHPDAETLVGGPIVILPALLIVEAHMRAAGGVA